MGSSAFTTPTKGGMQISQRIAVEILFLEFPPLLRLLPQMPLKVVVVVLALIQVEKKKMYLKKNQKPGKNQKQQISNKFSPLARVEESELGGGYSRRERKLSNMALELEEQKKKRSLAPEYQTIAPPPLPLNHPKNDHFLEYQGFK